MSMKKLQEARKAASATSSEDLKKQATTPKGDPPSASAPTPKTTATNGNEEKEKKKKKVKKTEDGEGKKKKKKKTTEGEDGKKKKKKKKGEEGSKKKKGTKRVKKPKDGDEKKPDTTAEPEEELDEGKKFFREVCNGNEKEVRALIQKGVPPGILNGLQSYNRDKTNVGCTTLHVASEKQNWKIFESLAFTAKADINAKDTEENSAFLWAVKNGATRSIVEKLVEKANADVFLANKEGKTVFFYAEDEVLEYLCEILTGLFPTLYNLLGGDDEIGKRYAVATAYSISFSAQRKALGTVPDEFWEKLVHLIRFDPSGKTPSSPVDVLLPVITTLYNFAIDEKYALAIAKQGAGGATFAFLFGLMCKHASSTVQSYAGDALFSLSRFNPNKDVLAAKWFPILVKLLSNPNPVLQKKSCRIMAEVSIDHAKGREKLAAELGAGRLVGLLKAQSHLTNEVCRMLANLTQGGRNTQLEVLGEDGFAPCVHAAVVATDAESTCSALTILGNLLEAVGDSKYKDDVIGALSRENLFESISEAVNQGLTQESERVLTLLAANEPIKRAVQQLKPAVPALKKLSNSSNGEIKKAALLLLGS